MRGNSALVDQCVAFYEEHFPNNYYLELIRTGRADEESYLHAAVRLAEERGLPVVATNDVRFLDAGDFDAHEIRVAIHDGFTLMTPSVRVTTLRSSICAAKTRCVSFSPTSRKRWKTR
jgi:DNA polymerase-3 subunit alpha